MLGELALSDKLPLQVLEVVLPMVWPQKEETYLELQQEQGQANLQTCSKQVLLNLEGLKPKTLVFSSLDQSLSSEVSVEPGLFLGVLLVLEMTILTQTLL